MDWTQIPVPLLPREKLFSKAKELDDKLKEVRERQGRIERFKDSFSAKSKLNLKNNLSDRFQAKLSQDNSKKEFDGKVESRNPNLDNLTFEELSIK